MMMGRHITDGPPENDTRVIKEANTSLQSDYMYDSSATVGSDNSSCVPIKHLRFSDDAHVIAYLPLPKEMDDEQHRALWWGPQDYEVFAETTKSISKQVRRQKSLTVGLDLAYRRAEALSQELEEEEMDETMQHDMLDHGLAHWCTHGLSRRGLERSVSKLHAQSRGDDVQTLKKKMVALKGPSADELRRISEQNSLPSKVFARMMGEADAEAASRMHTFMRRWSDLGSNRPEEHERMRHTRTGSLPHYTWNTPEI